ncbi:MAG: helix-turn-helix transcriptional regulator [Lawsonibacter sp.]
MIGTKISFCRKKAGLSQEALATRLNISRQAVSRWETGEAVPDTEKIVQLSRLFQVSTDYLLLDEIKEPLTGQNPTGIQTGPAKEKRRHLRIYFGKCLLVIGLIALAAILIGAGVYADSLNEWYTAWGRYGTALFKTWIIVPFLLSACISAGGVIILWAEYFRED